MKKRCGDKMDFQNVNPELFIVVGELLGNVIANELPFNVQNAVGNWLQLVGQAIETYNAQQQYYQQGPGRYFTPDSFNVDNPFCQQTEQSSQSGSAVSGSGKTSEEEILSKSSRSVDTGDVRANEVSADVLILQETLEKLLNRMEQLEEEIRSLKNQGENH